MPLWRSLFRPIPSLLPPLPRPSLMLWSHRPVDSLSPCQHPGSPWWPQQLLNVNFFFMLFLNKSQLFLERGISTCRLVRNMSMLGRRCLWLCILYLILAYERQDFGNFEIDEKPSFVLLAFRDGVGLSPSDLTDYLRVVLLFCSCEIESLAHIFIACFHEKIYRMGV
jgi:hypothetical protein